MSRALARSPIKFPSATRAKLRKKATQRFFLSLFFPKRFSRVRVGKPRIENRRGSQPKLLPESVNSLVNSPGYKVYLSNCRRATPLRVWKRASRTRIATSISALIAESHPDGFVRSMSVSHKSRPLRCLLVPASASLVTPEFLSRLNNARRLNPRTRPRQLGLATNPDYTLQVTLHGIGVRCWLQVWFLFPPPTHSRVCLLSAWNPSLPLPTSAWRYTQTHPPPPSRIPPSTVLRFALTFPSLPVHSSNDCCSHLRDW